MPDQTADFVELAERSLPDDGQLGSFLPDSAQPDAICKFAVTFPGVISQAARQEVDLAYLRTS